MLLGLTLVAGIQRRQIGSLYDGLVLASLLAIVALPKLPLSKASSGPKPCVTFATNSSVLTSKGDSPRLQPGRTGSQAPLLLCEEFPFSLLLSSSSACLPFFLLSTWPAPQRGLARNLNLVKPQLPLAHQSSVTRPSTNQEAPQLPLPLPHGRPREEVAEVTFKPKSSGWTGFVHATPLENTRTHIYIYIYIYITPISYIY